MLVVQGGDVLETSKAPGMHREGKGEQEFMFLYKILGYIFLGNVPILTTLLYKYNLCYSMYLVEPTSRGGGDQA
jgi:hypothetical protein